MTQTLVDFIKTYANDHYEDGGWDVIVECWSDDDILDYLLERSAESQADALYAFRNIVEVWADRQADARNSAF